MAIAFLSQGRHEEATQYLQYLLHRHPRNPSGLSLLGDIAYDRGDLEKAEAMYREALALSPSLHGVCNNLAWLLLRSGRPEEAKGYAMQATAFAPQNASYYDTLAKILEELGDQQAADSAADKARELLALESPEAEK